MRFRSSVPIGHARHMINISVCTADSENAVRPCFWKTWDKCDDLAGKAKRPGFAIPVHPITGERYGIIGI
jgi:hypothetical protein